MKTEITQEPAEFAPIKVEITLETKEEAEKFTHLMCWTPVYDLMNETRPNNDCPLEKLEKILGIQASSDKGLKSFFSHPAMANSIKLIDQPLKEKLRKCFND